MKRIFNLKSIQLLYKEDSKSEYIKPDPSLCSIRVLYSKLSCNMGKTFKDTKDLVVLLYFLTQIKDGILKLFNNPIPFVKIQVNNSNNWYFIIDN